MATATQEKTTTELANKNGATAQQEPKLKITTRVMSQIEGLVKKGTLDLPQDYSFGNALNAAWLKLQEVQNLDKKPLIVNGQLSGIVTEASVANALHDMVIQGLTVAKNQGYFIVYGQALTWQRSYFGDMAIAQRVMPKVHFYYDVIREGDEFATEKVRTSRGFVLTIAKHVQTFPQTGAILGAYCGVVDENGEELGVDLMDMPRIKKSWGMSKTFGKSQSTPHVTFEAEMAMRTVIRHRCKQIINSSSDALLLDAVRRQDEEAVAASIDAEATEFGNGELLGLDPVTDAQFVQSPEAEPEIERISGQEQPPLVGEDPGY